MNEKGLGNCVHHSWSKDGAVCLANDEDGYYVTEFNTQDELNIFIGKLNEAARKAFGAYPCDTICSTTSCSAVQKTAELIEEIRAYLVAAEDGSMSRNNSEQLAAELLERIDHNLSNKPQMRCWRNERERL